MSDAELGKTYEDGAVILRQGDVGDCLYVVQEGTLEILIERDGHVTRLGIVGPGEMIGEMAVFERQVRSATVRAVGRARVMTIDKKNFLKRINEDPSLAFRIVETMSRRIRELNTELARLKGAAAINDGGCNGATGSGPATVASFSTRCGGPAGSG